MLFVSEEFLRQYESGEDFEQTIDGVVAEGADLFEEGTYQSKKDARKKK
jgi:hypothetical protein